MTTEKEKEKPEQTDREKMMEAVQILSKMWGIEHGLKKTITSDFILAHLNEKEKEFVNEMYGNAVFARDMIIMYATHGKRYSRDEKKNKWIINEDQSFRKEDLTAKEKLQIIATADRLFNCYMKRVLMVITLARNDKNNFLIKLLVTATKKDEDDEREEEEPQEKGWFQKIMDRIR